MSPSSESGHGADAGAWSGPDQTSDDESTGWGEDLRELGEDDPDDTERFLRDVPPHHGT
jgi:hypothetical protein